MSDLTSSTVLQRITDLDLRIDSANKVVIDARGRRIESGRHGLVVLAEFSQPRTVAAALETLSGKLRGAEDWKELTATILAFYEAGVLRDASRRTTPARRPLRGYSVAPVHIKMLNDRVRTESFLAGIRRVVRPGDVVVDLGTGTGVLAMAAARAGARHVYAIEESGIAAAAEALFEANGLADRISLLRGRSTEIDLPERGDVLISEMIGDDPLGERILEVTRDAVTRWLEPDARLVPSRIRLFGLPVNLPEAELARVFFRRRTLERWSTWYGADFEPLADVVECRTRCYPVDPFDARRWPALSEGIPLLEVALSDIRGAAFQRTATATAARDGDVDGVLVYFEAELGPGVRLSTDPASVTADNHWRSRVWLLSESVPLRAGERFEVTYARGVAGTPDGVTVARR